jgi:hypothetical protein
MFHPAPAPTQADVEAIVELASKRILRFLKRRGVITLVTAPGDGEVTVVTDETMGEEDPLLARLLAAATAGAPPAGPANKRKVIRIVLDPNAHPVARGHLCGQHAGFNVHAATRVAANDEQGRLALCKYILRPPLANDRLTIIDGDHVRLAFKKPWSDGTSSVELPALALIARLAALVVPSGPWACPPCTCPTRLRRARRRRHVGISRGTLACSRRTAATAASACLPPCWRRRQSQKTSPRVLRVLCRCRTTFPGASFSEERSRSTRHALAARPRCGLSLSSRPTTPSRRSCPRWPCPPRRPSFIPHAPHALRRGTLVVRMGTC